MRARNAAMTKSRIVSRSLITIITSTIVARMTPSTVRMARRGTRFASARSNRRSRRVCAGSGCITPAWQVRGERSCQHGRVTAEGQAPARHKRRLRSDVRWGITGFVVVLVAEYLVIPELAGARESIAALRRVNVAYLVAGVLLEAAALTAYALLTRAVLPQGVIKLGRLLRIDLSAFATSHVVPGGSAPATALSFRLLTASGVEGPDAAFALATQGVGSAVVLNGIFWVVLVISLFIRGYNPLYLVAAGVGVLLIGAFAAVVLLLLEGRERAVEIVHRLADHLPFLSGDRTDAVIRRVAARLRTLVDDRELLRRAVG